MITTTLQTHIRSMHVFLLASLLIHALLLCIPIRSPLTRKAPAWPNRLFAVELLRPDEVPEHINTLDDNSAPPALPAPAADMAATKQPAPEPAAATHDQSREATVSLNRMNDADAQYRSYLGHLRSKISTVWEYPQEACDRRLNGIVTVRFSIARTGRLTALEVTQCSAHQVLDRESMRTIKAAAPFLPFPPEFSIETLHVLASFEYELSAH